MPICTNLFKFKFKIANLGCFEGCEKFAALHRSGAGRDSTAAGRAQTPRRGRRTRRGQGRPAARPLPTVRSKRDPPVHGVRRARSKPAQTHRGLRLQGTSFVPSMPI